MRAVHIPPPCVVPNGETWTFADFLPKLVWSDARWRSDIAWWLAFESLADKPWSTSVVAVTDE